MERVILHCDLNNFYASVEILAHPEYKGKPLIVCGNPEKRHGIVLAKSNEAKAKGVQTGEAIWQAQKKCPGLIMVAPRHSLYGEISKQVFYIYSQYTDRVESFGLDECWLDVTHSQKLFGDGEKIANTIRERVKNDLGLTISVGVSFNKIFAKLGSDMKKPDAVTVIKKDEFKEKIWNLPASDMLMVGRKTANRLQKMNIHTIGELAKADRKLMKEVFGVVGLDLIKYANGEDDSEVGFSYDNAPPLSVGHGTTMEHDVTSAEAISPVVFALSDMVATRLRKYKLKACGIHVTIKDNEFSHCSKQIILDIATDSGTIIARKAMNVINSLYDFSSRKPVRAVTVSAIRLTSESDGYQLSIFGDENEKQSKLESALDKIREKYGYSAINRATSLSNVFLCDNLNFDDD